MKPQFHLDPEENRRSLMAVVLVILIDVMLLCGIGAYIGLFVGFRLAGG